MVQSLGVICHASQRLCRLREGVVVRLVVKSSLVVSLVGIWVQSLVFVLHRLSESRADYHWSRAVDDSVWRLLDHSSSDLGG